MTTQLDSTEINQIQQLLNDYEPAQKALVHVGWVERSETQHQVQV
ncbi:hypothetical protein [Plectonema radiosum]|nr:hypothetical protein [Plectonema radiosum]